MENTQQTNVKTGLSPVTGAARLAETAMLIALATALSAISILQMPAGGSITPLSTLPMIIIGFRYGPKWGVPSMLAAGLLQLILGLKNVSYAQNAFTAIIIILFDYLVAFGVYGLAGIFRGKIKNNAFAIAAGALFTSFLRFICHYITGIAIWGTWAPEGQPVWLYSLLYNGGYMLVEGISVTIAAFLLSQVLDFTSRDLRKRTKN